MFNLLDTENQQELSILTILQVFVQLPSNTVLKQEILL